MKRITVSLPDSLVEALRREAAHRGEPVSALVRAAVTEHLEQKREGELPFVALGRSGRRHTARDAEKILARELGRARRR